MTHHALAAALARSGYIVAALTHPGDNYRDRSIGKALNKDSPGFDRAAAIRDAANALPLWFDRALAK